MAKRIRAIRQTTETYYDDDGAVAREVRRVAYLKEDADDVDFAAWVDVDPASVDVAEPHEAQRTAIHSAASRREGIA